jgi:hypothetical protein
MKPASLLVASAVLLVSQVAFAQSASPQVVVAETELPVTIVGTLTGETSGATIGTEAYNNGKIIPSVLAAIVISGKSFTFNTTSLTGSSTGTVTLSGTDLKAANLAVVLNPSTFEFDVINKPFVSGTGKDKYIVDPAHLYVVAGSGSNAIVTGSLAISSTNGNVTTNISSHLQNDFGFAVPHKEIAGGNLQVTTTEKVKNAVTSTSVSGRFLGGTLTSDTVQGQLSLVFSTSKPAYTVAP